MKLSFFILFTLVSWSAFSQQPPKVCSDAFLKKFYMPDNVNWRRQKANEWIADFSMGDSSMHATFDLTGKWLSTALNQDSAKIPEKVFNMVKTEFPKHNIEKMEKVVYSDGKIWYEFNVENDDSDVELALDSLGKIVHKEIYKFEDESEDD